MDEKKEKTPQKRSGGNWLWPEITDERSARSAIMRGVKSNGIVSVVTLLFVLMKLVETSAIWDAIIFTILGFGIYKTSRTAAVAALVLLIIEKLYVLAEDGQFKNSLIFWFVLSGLVSSVRGTFALKRFLPEPIKKPEPPHSPSIQMGNESKPEDSKQRG